MNLMSNKYVGSIIQGAAEKQEELIQILYLPKYSVSINYCCLGDYKNNDN
jgi:hypothetical protein